jgi:GDPmannose 4,6-dehydratase
MKRTAIITGICGQDGSYLADLLLGKGYRVFGLKRRTSSNDLGCATHLEHEAEIVEGDLADLHSLNRLCRLARAEEFYNLAAQSHVGTSFDQPLYTLIATGQGVLNCLEAIRQSGVHTRFYQASTSELFGGGHGETLLSEGTMYHPRSPYACAKLYGYWITVNYRESYKMYACNGISFNHESPRRGPAFVTRKITMAVARIKAGKQRELRLGNLDAKRDWGHARDYVQGMWLMLQQNWPDDYILATGTSHSVREFCQIAFEHASIDNYQKYVVYDPSYCRAAEVDVLIGNATKAKTVLGWQPNTTFEALVREMVDADLSAMCKSASPVRSGPDPDLP